MRVESLGNGEVTKQAVFQSCRLVSREHNVFCSFEDGRAPCICCPHASMSIFAPLIKRPSHSQPRHRQGEVSAFHLWFAALSDDQHYDLTDARYATSTNFQCLTRPLHSISSTRDDFPYLVLQRRRASGSAANAVSMSQGECESELARRRDKYCSNSAAYYPTFSSFPSSIRHGPKIIALCINYTSIVVIFSQLPEPICPISKASQIWAPPEPRRTQVPSVPRAVCR